MSVNQPFYIKAALNRYCRTVTVAKCPCNLSNVCCVVSGKPYMTDDKDVIAWAFKELMLI